MTAKFETVLDHGAVVEMPLNKLRTSPKNVRKVPHTPGEIESRAASIAAKGMLQPLVVEPEPARLGEPTGFFLVTIGEGRRLAQCLRAKRKEICKAEPVRCVIVIYTDRRLYQLEMTAGPSAWMASLAWSYPQDELITLRAQNAAAETATPIADGVRLERLQFRYAISGDTPAWRPVNAFDDGEKVYIQFPAGVAQTELPPLFVVGDKGEAQLINYRVRPPYYVVDGLFGAAELRLGGKRQAVVRIERTDGRKARGLFR